MYAYSDRRKFLLVGCLLIAFLFYPLAADAAMIITGDNTIINPGETIDDDLYIFGDTVTISGLVMGDAVIFASEAIVDGTITGSLLVFAQTIRISGDVEGAIRGGANMISFQGVAGRDLIMAANTISLAGEIGKDLFCAASNVAVTAPVGRNIQASANRLDVDAPVGGSITARVGDLVFGPLAQVDGAVTYYSENEATLDSGAIIGGAIKRLDPPVDRVAVSPARSTWSFIFPILSLLAVALVMALLFPLLTAGTARTIGERPGPSVGYGALLVFVAPLAAIFLIITVIGIPISFLSMLLYIVLIYLTRVFAGYFLAQVVLEKFGKELHPVWTALIGVLVLALLIRIPFVGWLIHLAAVLFAAGAFILYLAGRKADPVV